MTFPIDRIGIPGSLRIGTSSFGNADWVGSFYPEKTKRTDFLRSYSERLDTVEIDSTWYAVPTARTVDGWAEKTPDRFLISAKVPRSISHDLYLEGCGDEWIRFRSVIDRLGPKGGPLLFQFPYIAKKRDADEYRTGDDFRRRLSRFLTGTAGEGTYAVEIRNRTWLDSPLFDLLREHGVPLVLSDYYTMPRADEYFAGHDPMTGPFGYIRFLGHHREMDRLVREAKVRGEREREWESLLVDRRRETAAWIAVIRNMLKTRSDIFAYFNNHYAGFAPGSIDLFTRLWREK